MSEGIVAKVSKCRTKRIKFKSLTNKETIWTSLDKSRLGSDQDYVNPYDQSSGSGVESDTDPVQDQDLEEYRRTSGRKSYPSNLGPGTSSKLESYTSQEAVDGSRTTSYQHNSRGGDKDVHHRQRERGRSTKTSAPLKDNKAEHRNTIDPTKSSEGSQDTVQPSDASPERKDRGRARSQMISG
ncbi:MAG: hypothetical protein Q9202_001483 [Teloschistes flavicans]